MAINWNLIGPVLGAIVLILSMIFAFIVRMRKMDRTSHNPPKNTLGTLDKKTLCFAHEGKISKNTANIENVGKQLDKLEKSNSDAHGKIFDKLEETQFKIIAEIKKNG